MHRSRFRSRRQGRDPAILKAGGIDPSRGNGGLEGLEQVKPGLVDQAADREPGLLEEASHSAGLGQLIMHDRRPRLAVVVVDLAG
ncbi:hypothetical protein TRIP_B110095 [uncultured Desulfatiglans sp.]|nr:hypothetical protein TRIP_B110095 [uncultured Desulfatiglans sp.]